MNKTLKTLFSRETKPRKSLILMEWAVVIYTLVTLVFILFTTTKLQHPDAMIWGRFRVLATLAALFFVYRLQPCKLTMLARVVVQLALLAWWYPETYELNRILPNMDHHFAAWEQSLFGFQPALTFSKMWPWPWLSELMDMGYAAYYPMIAGVVLFYFFARYDQFQRCAFVVMASFFMYYLIYICVPVTGPTFYFHAIGIENAQRGVFPAVNDYFNFHRECLPSPGWTDGFFYHLVEDAKAAGERPTAAFPSSHVGISTICMLLAWQSGSRKLVFILLPFYVFLCMATVYIQAHYAIDAFAGLLSGVLFYVLALYMFGIFNKK